MTLEKRCYIPLPDGKKIAMPRYYKDFFFSDVEKNKIVEYLRHNQKQLTEQQKISKLAFNNQRLDKSRLNKDKL